MGNSLAHNDDETVDQVLDWIVRLNRNRSILSLEDVETGKKMGNQTGIPVPMPNRRRYYSHSKPGGPLSQDTHTSSGLSFYGLGVAT
jgi:hypothetical protein